MKFRIECKSRSFVLYQQVASGWKVVGRYRSMRAAEVALSVRYNQGV